LTVRTSVRDDLRMNVRTNLLLPKELVDEVDHFAGERGRSRYVAEALRAKLKRDRFRQMVAATAGVLKAEDYPHWATSDQVVQWVRERRREVTDPGPDGSR
jgi:metal-responsive CopG/Arc/MetJ family transcriptional regulator